jgi:hypothetical protein
MEKARRTFVLVDTLLGSWLHAWKLNRATKLVSHPKSYFFDAGVARALSARLPHLPPAEEMGTIFQTSLLHEVRAFLSYTDRRYPMYFFLMRRALAKEHQCVCLACQIVRSLHECRLAESPQGH